MAVVVVQSALMYPHTALLAEERWQSLLSAGGNNYAAKVQGRAFHQGLCFRFKVEITNEQRVYDEDSSSNEGCYFDYNGTVLIRNNNFGLLGRDTVKVEGARKFTFDGNM